VALAELTRHPAYLRLHLSGLSLDETARFIQSAGGATPSAEALSAIHDRTEGHPLFLVETVR
jgi:predicted ATPase